MNAALLRLLRVFLYLGWTLPMMLTQGVALALRLPLSRHIPPFYHRRTCRILGIRLKAQGAMSRRRPTLFVSNHISYVDIEVLGALIEGCFVAKSEVASWPLFGWLAKLQRTVFIDRRTRSTMAQRDAIRRRLDAGDSLILFPEGTSGDGTHVLPFKSALFSVADYAAAGGALPVQPVTVAYVRLDGIPLGRFYRPFFAWYGDMALAPHLWTMLGLGVVGVEVIFHPPVTLAALGSRKALADHCYRVISAGLAGALAGRPQIPAREGAAGAAAAAPVAAVGAG
jgi:lyso-ornithine lipid O-acyltransferase